MKKTDWSIRYPEASWECDWKGSEKFQMRYFKALSLTEKCRAVENMCKTAQYFQLKAMRRRRIK